MEIIMQLSESLPCLPCLILTCVERSVGYVRNVIYGLTKIRIYYRSTWLKIGNARQRLVADSMHLTGCDV
jgi:hypothetical protein